MKNNLGGTPQTIAYWKGDVNAIKFFLSQPNIDFGVATYEGASPLYFAAQEGHAAVVKLLLAHPHISVNQTRHINGTSPLFMAAQKGHAAGEALIGPSKYQYQST